MRRTVLAAAAAVALAFAACGSSEDGSAPADTTTPTTIDITGRVRTYLVTGRLHVEGPVDYAQTPPVGGDHAAVWQNCGFYSQPVSPEQAVHSMEHGAVWITFRPDLPRRQVDILRNLGRRNPYVLVSPWTDDALPAPVVASAWGLQMTAESADDAGVATFVQRFANGPQTPERGAPCTGGAGNPA